ncbi:hypothetical protein PybrP1_008380 [[Pythium] brassicae (nom. inval.)]|nr:hypothetical protein PybrP1_008380 [[Pythium] brassicae (nom. inval.)]
MERSRVAQHQRQFLEQFDQLDSELRDLEAALGSSVSGTVSQPPIASSSSTASDASALPESAALELTSPTDSAHAHDRLQQQLLRANYRIADLCDRHHDYQLAALYYHKVLEWLQPRDVVTSRLRMKSRETSKPLLGASSSATSVSASTISSTDTDKDENAVGESAKASLTENELLLKENVLNNLSAMCFGAGDHAQAMSYLLDAKKLLEHTLTANYALYLHAKGDIEDAIHAASAVIKAVPAADTRDDASGARSLEIARAKTAACSLLSSCWRTKGDDEQAMAFASRAAQLAEVAQDPLLLSRAHNNLALCHFQRRELTTALDHLLTAYRATQAAQDLQQHAVVTYHIGLVVAELEVGVELPQSGRGERPSRSEVGSASASASALAVAALEEEDEEKEEPADRRDISRPSSRKDEPAIGAAAVPSTITTRPPSDAASVAAPSAPASVRSPTASTSTSARECFVRSESLADALLDPDHSLTLLAHGCQGESAYYASEFHTAEAELSVALQRLRELSPRDRDRDEDANTETPSRLPPSAMSLLSQPQPPLAAAELDAIHGHLLSFIGCTQLVEGQFALAEASHERDLAIALCSENIVAQQRAVRNLALVYSSTQRYSKAIPLWREALEIASVLQSKPDQMMAYSGLGTALKELRITDRQKHAFAALLGARENDPLHIFQRQRSLALELGNRKQQIVAQRNIVSTYESPDRPDLEQRLTECDALVRLCEQGDSLQHRGDAYRSLANALTAQIARLNARGARFAEAVSVLTQKRNSVCGKYEQTARTLRAVTAARLRADEGELGTGRGGSKTVTSADDEHARAPILHVEVLMRR